MLIFLKYIILTLITIVPVILAVAFYTVAERRIMARMQKRQGPNVVGIQGILQPFADALKLIIKESAIPQKAHSSLFILAPCLTLFLSLLSWAVIPISGNTDFSFISLNHGVLFVLAVSSLGVYGVLFAGLASNSKYAVMGGIRSVAQMISYEIAIGFIILNVVTFSGSLNFFDIIESQQHFWYLFPLFPLFLIFLVCILAETNRAPFDLPEAEAELVAGFNIEYSGILFAMFFLGEYSNMILMSALTVIFFMGGGYFLPLNIFELNYYYSGSSIFLLKLGLIMFFFIWTRATVPRYRYDQLMNIGWKIFLPFTLSFFIFSTSFAFSFDLLYSLTYVPVCPSEIIYKYDIFQN